MLQPGWLYHLLSKLEYYWEWKRTPFITTPSQPTWTCVFLGRGTLMVLLLVAIQTPPLVVYWVRLSKFLCWKHFCCFAARQWNKGIKGKYTKTDFSFPYCVFFKRNLQRMHWCFVLWPSLQRTQNVPRRCVQVQVSSAAKLLIVYWILLRIFQ